MSTPVLAVHLCVCNYVVHACGIRLTACVCVHVYYHVCVCGGGHGPWCALCAHLCCVCLGPLLMSVYMYVQVPFRVSKPVLTHVGLEIAVCALPLYTADTHPSPTYCPGGEKPHEVGRGTRPSVLAEEVPRCISDTGWVCACPQLHLSTHTHVCT